MSRVKRAIFRPNFDRNFVSTVHFELMVTVMLVTRSCWWLYDGDTLKMLVAYDDTLYKKNRSNNLKSVTNISNLSPTQTIFIMHQQHRYYQVDFGLEIGWNWEIWKTLIFSRCSMIKNNLILQASFTSVVENTVNEFF